MTKRLADQQASSIAAVSSVIAGSVAVFWIVQLIRGAAPRDDLFLGVNIIFFVAMAYMFGQLTRQSGNIGVMTMLLFLSNALRFVRNPLAKQDLGVAGAVTFALAVGLFAADLALRYRHRRAAEPRVAADGAAPRR
jgi:hypothetical protein